MNRLQEDTRDRLCRANGGRLHVREGYADGHVEITTPSGACWKIDEDGTPYRTRGDWSVRWEDAA